MNKIWLKDLVLNHKKCRTFVTPNQLLVEHNSAGVEGYIAEASDEEPSVELVLVELLAGG